MARKSPAPDAVALQSEFSPIGRTRVQVAFDEPEVLDWLEKNGVHDALGLATNAVLRREVEPLLARAASIHHEVWTRFRCFHAGSTGHQAAAV